MKLIKYKIVGIGGVFKSSGSAKIVNGRPLKIKGHKCALRKLTVGWQIDELSTGFRVTHGYTKQETILSAHILIETSELPFIEKAKEKLQEIGIKYPVNK